MRAGNRHASLSKMQPRKDNTDENWPGVLDKSYRYQPMYLCALALAMGTSDGHRWAQIVAIADQRDSGFDERGDRMDYPKRQIDSAAKRDVERY
jgi:hypothetical protein